MADTPSSATGWDLGSVSYTFPLKRKDKSFLVPYEEFWGRVPVTSVRNERLPCWKTEMHRYSNLPSFLIINVLRWMISRWSKAGTWTCSHKTILRKLECSSWKDTWKKRMEQCSRRYIPSVKYVPFTLSIVLADDSDQKKHTREEEWYTSGLLLQRCKRRVTT